MKKYLMCTFLVAFGLFGAGCDSKTNSNDNGKQTVEEKALNLVSGKPNIIFVTKKHCSSCEEMKETIKGAEINSMIESGFNLVFLEIEDISLLPKNLSQPIGTPTLYFVDAGGSELIEPLAGAADAQSFKTVLNSAINEYKLKYPNAK